MLQFTYNSLQQKKIFDILSYLSNQLTHHGASTDVDWPGQHGQGESEFQCRNMPNSLNSHTKQGMCKNLVEKGNLEKPLILYNRTKKRAEDLAATLPAGKTEVVDSIAEGVKKADIIFTIVSNDAAVKEAIGAILESDVKGKLVVECSTIHPDMTNQVAQDVLAKGAEFIASPVFGAPAAAAAGMLV